MHKHRVINTIGEFIDDAIEMHVPPNSHAEEKQIEFFGELKTKLLSIILNTQTDTCCGQSVIFKISQTYPLISVWRNPRGLTEALIDEIHIMFGIV